MSKESRTPLAYLSSQMEKKSKVVSDDMVLKAAQACGNQENKEEFQ